MESAGHIPVLMDEILELLAPQQGEALADCTAGRGGHASEIGKRVGASGTVVLSDLDAGNLHFAEGRVRALPDAPRVIAVHGSFERMPQALRTAGLQAHMLLADLGFASNQMDDPARGLAFGQPGPLDMRLDPGSGPTAEALLATMTESQLADTIFELGEDPFARRIARCIIERRQQGALRTTQDLADAVRKAYGSRAHQSRVHPATRTFMALRIAVNQELERLDALLSAVGQAAASIAAGKPTWLAPGARVAIVAFHSLEDRSIKRSFVEWERQGWASRLTKKPLVANESEQAHNPRSRSAKLRAVRLEPRGEDDAWQDHG